MRIIALAIVACALLTACATPVLMLKNPKTGQIVRCGGEKSGSMALGMIGYNIQKNTDQACANDYEAQGFTRIQH